MSAFNDAWTLLKQQMSLLPFGFATGNPTQDALAYLGAGPGAQEGPAFDRDLPTVSQDELDDRFEEFLDRQKTRGVPRYQLDVTRDESGYRDSLLGLNPYLTADGQDVGKFPMSPAETETLRRNITRGRGRDVVAHTSMPMDEIITDYYGDTHLMDSDTSIPKTSFYPTGSAIDDEHQGKGLYIRSLLSLLSTPEAMGLSAKDVARENKEEGFNPQFDNVPDTLRGFKLSDVDPQLFNEIYGQRGLISPPSRTGGKGGSDRSHQILSERYKKIMDLLGEDLHTYGEGQTLSNIMDMAERGEGMFSSHGGKLKHNILEGPYSDPKDRLKDPRGKIFFYDPISVDIGKNPLERETFGDLRRFDLAGLPVRVKRPVTLAESKRLRQTRLGDFSQPDIDEMYPPLTNEERGRMVRESRRRPSEGYEADPQVVAAAEARESRRRNTRQRERRVQEAIDSLGDLFTSGQEDEQRLPLEMQPRTDYEVIRDAIQDIVAGEEFNEILVNTERDVDIKNSLKYLDEHIGKRHYDKRGFAYPSPFDNLPKNMQINLGRDVAFLENMQNQNSRTDALREALRRAEEKREGTTAKEHFDDIFNPDVAAENTVGLGALRRNIIFEEIDKAIARIRIVNHHLRHHPVVLSGRLGRAAQRRAHGLLSDHLDDLFHPIHGNMMDN